jgi:DNA polymerase-1
MYLDWKDRPERYIVIDIETDDLNATVIHVLCWEDVKTGEKGTCIGQAEILDFFARTRGSFYVAHNGLKFDVPTLNGLAGTRVSPSVVIDTLVLSALYSPSLEGGHSLGAWGERLGKPKGEFSDFSRLTPEMIAYCQQDVSVTATLYRRLAQTMKRIGFSELSCKIQHEMTVILARQQKNGFYFNGPEAIVLYQKLRGLEAEIAEEVRKVFPPTRVLVRERAARTKAGELCAQYHKDAAHYLTELLDDGRYRAYEDVPFNLGSPKDRVAKLLELGWEPEEFTPKTKTGGGGNPKPFDKGDLSPSLKKFLEDRDIPEVKLIAKWMSYNGRANMINTWLENWNEATSCIHGKLFVADTLRFRHQAPNTANIPAVRSKKDGSVLLGEEGYFTYESRDLWTARPGRVLVGTDAAGLELRMLAHYLNRPEFTKQVVEGDPHQFNADAAGVTRPVAKTLIYAIQYGAQGPKVAKILNRPTKEGARIRQEFLDRLGLTEVMDAAIHEQETGRVWLVDGAGVICPSPHAALNYKLQGGGARVMALGATILEKKLWRKGIDSLKVGDIHDEWQYDVAPDDAEEHGRLAVESIREAGEMLNLNVPLDGTSKKGLTWAETH